MVQVQLLSCNVQDVSAFAQKGNDRRLMIEAIHPHNIVDIIPVQAVLVG